MKFDGLTEHEVEQSRRENGENIITPPKRVSMWKLYFEKFNDPIIKILLFAVVLSLLIAFTDGHFTEVIGVTLAVFLATSIGFWFEYDANKKFGLLNSLCDEALVRVIRGCVVTEIKRKDVVIGDIVLLEGGEEVPADGELLDSLSLIVNESMLTGELMVHKTVTTENCDKDATYPSNMVYRGTTVMEGSGVMRVVAIGDSTELGNITKLSTEQTKEKTPLTLQLEHLAEIISVVGGGFAYIVFVALYLKDIFSTKTAYTDGQELMLIGVLVTLTLAIAKMLLSIAQKGVLLIKKNRAKRFALLRVKWWMWVIVAMGCYAGFAVWANTAYGVNGFDLGSWLSLGMCELILSYFMIAVTLIVVAVPEGLPMSVTLSLALNMRRMLKTNNLVRKMHASETMGAINVICTDKTGTLTQNQMRVFDMNFFIESDNLRESKEFSILEEAISVNTTAYLETDDKCDKVKSIGNPTEAALLLWLEEHGCDYLKIREELKILCRIAFSTRYKYMATMVDSGVLDGKVVYLKGAPEVIMGLCSKISIGGELKDIELFRAEIEKSLLDYQNGAKRTLGFAYKVTKNEESKETIEEGDFVFMGVAAISDPIRVDVPDAVAQVKNAGIDVKIVTGDTPATAIEIARQIGIWSDESDCDKGHITGVDFEAKSDEELMESVGCIKVMSRARPHDKQRLVQILQRIGKVVAVTGDGTNDAPALNHAHVGLSMGSGTSVAKEASDITLIDDSFKSISTAVMWGRSLYKNIQRFLYFQLTINCLALVIVLSGTLLGFKVPLTVTQMLWVNLIMDTFAAAALASLPPRRKVMDEKPRAKDAFIVTPLIWKSIFGMALFQLCCLVAFLLLMRNFFNEEYGLTIFFTMFVMMQFWNMFNARTLLSGNESAFKGMKINDPFIYVALAIFIGQVLIVTFGGEMFRAVPLEFMHWVAIVCLTSLILWGGEIQRWYRRRACKKGK